MTSDGRCDASESWLKLSSLRPRTRTVLVLVSVASGEASAGGAHSRDWQSVHGWGTAARLKSAYLRK